MLVSFCVVARNESKFIKEFLDSLLLQSYESRNVEVIFSVAPSSDETLEIIEHFKTEHIDKFNDILILNNEQIKQAPGMNLAITSAKGDIIIRGDAHSVLGVDFIKESVNTIVNGEFVCGGIQKSKIKSFSRWGLVVLFVDSSPFGGGKADFRNKDFSQMKYVSTLANGCYRREVFEKCGLFNLSLVRSEDNELSYRIRKNGYKICLNPKIESYYYARTNFRGVLKQKFENGKWIGITSVCMTPKIFSLFHFVPFIFVLSILVGLLFPLFSLMSSIPLIYFFLPIICLAGIYFGVAFLFSLKGYKEKKILWFIYVMPLMFFALHLVYGLGVILGICTSQKYKRKIKGGVSWMN